jgi:hypothetical protein
MFSQQHYVWIAAELRKQAELDPVFEQSAFMFAKSFARDEPRFKPGVFLKACGVVGDAQAKFVAASSRQPRG